MSAGKILVVDDDENFLELAKTNLTSADYKVWTTRKTEDAIGAVRGDLFDLSIVDLRLAGEDGMSLMEQLHSINPEMPVIILTGYGTIESAVAAIKKGAYGYITKPFDPHELLLQIGRALENRRLTSEVRRLKGLLRVKYDFDNIVAKSENMLRVLESVTHIANTESTVYIHGESGSGKELIAKAIHLASQRRDKPFVAINCAAIPETLLESELFGHEKGAFTGAIRSTKGLFTQGHEGSILLDEIGDMPLSIQAKLLRALEERQFYPVGSEKPVQVDVRLIAASKKNLEEDVKNGLFREDLFYRIHVIPIRLPPLRERKEDIPHLVDHFLRRICAQIKKDVKGISPEAMRRLMLHHWPGNVRELENILEYAVAMTQQDVIPEDLILPTDTWPGTAIKEVNLVTSLLPDQEMAKSLKEARAEFDRAYLIRLLELCGGSAAKAAQIAGKYRADFYDLLKKRGIKIQDFRKADCLVGNITRESGKSLQIGSPESASRALAPTRQ